MTKTFISLVLIFLVVRNAYATYPLYKSHFYTGLIVLKGNIDTIRGKILLEPLLYDSISYQKIFEEHKGEVVVSQFDSFTHSSKYLFFDQNQILFVRLYYWGNDYTDFKTFEYNSQTLLLRVVTSDKVDVLDGFLSPLRNIFDIYPYLRNQTIYIFKASKLEELPAVFSFNYKKHILKFLNKRYKTHFKLREFNSTYQMFDYISKYG